MFSPTTTRTKLKQSFVIWQPQWDKWMKLGLVISPLDKHQRIHVFIPIPAVKTDSINLILKVIPECLCLPIYLIYGSNWQWCMYLYLFLSLRHLSLPIQQVQIFNWTSKSTHQSCFITFLKKLKSLSAFCSVITFLRVTLSNIRLNSQWTTTMQ